MNDRIEELIVAYLHRSSTPEQDRELFDACREQPDVASALRRHIMLSLKLRQLRERTEVPAALKAELTGRINELAAAAEATAAREEHAAAPRRARRFGWIHIAGTAIAAAGVAAIVIISILRTGIPQQDRDTMASLRLPADTVRLVRADTVIQYRVIQHPVYIAKREASPARPGSTPNDIAQAQAPADSTTVSMHESPTDSTAVAMRGFPADSNSAPAAAVSQAHDAPSYLQQYTQMLTTLEKVRITAGDRIRD